MVSHYRKEGNNMQQFDGGCGKNLQSNAQIKEIKKRLEYRMTADMEASVAKRKSMKREKNTNKEVESVDIVEAPSKEFK